MREGKGGKDCVLMLPQSLVPGLREQLARAHVLRATDQAQGNSGVQMPDARAGASWPWFWGFPQATHSTDPRSGVVRRHHMFDQSFQRAFKRAVHAAGITKPATPRTPRHAFARLPPTCCKPATTSARCSRICWARRCRYDDDLHARAEGRRRCGTQPGGCDEPDLIAHITRSRRTTPESGRS